MKIRRIGAAGAIVATSALVLSACATPGGSEIDEGTAVNIGWNQPFYSQNNLTAIGNATANANVLYLTQAAFNYYDGDLELQRNEDFGSYEVVNEDPFTVEYTINEGVTWSDGVPVDAYDLTLWWGAQADELFNTAAPEYDDEGNVTNQDEVDAGVFFNSSSAAMNLVTTTPEISEDGQTMTIVYDSSRPDWELSFGLPSVAAHAVASLALDIDDAEQGKQAVYDAFANRDNEALGAIANTWNDDFNFTSLPDDERLYLSSGAYVMTEFVENQFLTVTARDDYDWGPQPSVESITIRYSEDPLAAVTALQNGEVDLIAPQASVDVIATLEGLDGVEWFSQPSGVYEHVDLIFDNSGPFDPASYDGDEETARLVRQAFLMALPRQEIIDVLIQPLDEDAQVRNSLVVTPGAPNYDEVVENNGSDFYPNEGDLDRAQELLEQAGVDTPIDVRFLYGASNVRRANQYQIIADAVSEAGFNLIDEGDDGWGSRLTDTASYDASLFGWQSTNTFALNSEANFITGGQNNFGGFSNAEQDALWRQMADVTDADAETELVIQIEQILFEEGFSLPIFQHPDIVAHRAALTGVSSMAVSPTIFWNYWEWTIDADDVLEGPVETEAPAEDETEE